MPWKTFDACLTTLSPTAPPPTLVPTVRPTRKPIGLPTRVSCYAQSVIGFLFAALFCWGSRRRDYVARAQKSIFILIGDLASNKSNRPRLIKLLYWVCPGRHAHPLFHFEILMLMRKLVRIDCINVDLARMSPVCRRCWLQCHYSLHQLQWYSLRPGPPGIYMPLCCWKVWLSEMSVSTFRSFDDFLMCPVLADSLSCLMIDYPWHS